MDPKNSPDSEAPPTDYFKFGKAMLRIWGLWPSRDLPPALGVLYNLYGILIVSCTIIPYIVCFTMDMLTQFMVGHWMEMLPRFSVALAMYLGIVKLAVYVFYKGTIEDYMKYYEGDIFTYKSTPFFKPNKIIKQCVFLYNIQVSVCFGLIGILVATDVDAYFRQTVPYFDNSTLPALPFVNWMPYDFSESPYYELSFLLTNFWFFVSADIVFVYDTICMGLMIHTGGQLKILRLAIESLRSRVFDELHKEGVKITANVIEERTRIMFRKCAVHHQAVIRQNDDIQKIFSTIIFFQFFISCLMVCFTIVIATDMESPLSSRMTSMIILSCSMWELSVYCYFGNEIITESNKLSLSIYMSDWVETDKSLKTSMMIMMTRAQRPIVFTAGGFVPLSLETFITVLKASYSYYAFLRTVADK